ncbi:MAG: hypothetical protein HWD92_09400 [Flavobacteriia bacterium]|nr:hypothetical protein [Flavobacteriia bacterium]
MKNLALFLLSSSIFISCSSPSESDLYGTWKGTTLVVESETINPALLEGGQELHENSTLEFKSDHSSIIQVSSMMMSDTSSFQANGSELKIFSPFDTTAYEWSITGKTLKLTQIIDIPGQDGEQFVMHSYFERLD